MTGGGSISPKYFRAFGKKELIRMDIFCRRGITDGHFGRGDNEKG